MFYSLQTIWQLALLSAGLAVLVVVSWRWPRWAGLAVVFLAPLYLLKVATLPLTVLEVMLWVFVLVWLAKKIKDKSPWPRIEKNHLLALGTILVGVVLAIIFSTDRSTGLGILKSWFLAPLAFAFVLADVLKDEGGVKNILTAIFASSLAVAAVGFFYFLFGCLTFDGRLAAFYLSPNHLAMFLAPGLLGGLILWPVAKRPSQKSLLFLAHALFLAVLYATASYGVWLGLGVALLFFWLCLRRFKIIGTRSLRFAALAALIVFLLMTLSQLNGSGSVKLESLLTSPRSSWQSRLMVWQAAIKILQEHWFLGIGPGAFERYYLEYQQHFPPYLEWAVPQPHNLFLAWWLQAGLVGLAGFFWLIIFFFRQTLADLARTKTLPAGLLAAVMVYFLTHGLVDTTFWKNDLALLFWVIVVLGSRVTRRAG